MAQIHLNSQHQFPRFFILDHRLFDRFAPKATAFCVTDSRRIQAGPLGSGLVRPGGSNPPNGTRSSL
ncbi:MAG: hypothetical protein ACK56F_25625 [bacterium]